MKGREIRKDIFVIKKIPSEQNLRRPVPAGGDVVCVRGTRTNLTSETKVGNLHKVRTLMNHMFKGVSLIHCTDSVQTLLVEDDR